MILTKIRNHSLAGMAVKNLCFAALVLVLAGCAPMPNHPVQELIPDQNTAVVTFYRPAAFVGSLRTYSIRENSQNVGSLKNGTYFSIRVTPGSHTYTSGKDTIIILAKPNSINYIEFVLTAGAWVAEPYFREVPAERAKIEIPKLKDIEPQPDKQQGANHDQS
jgi:hypothetical protein